MRDYLAIPSLYYDSTDKLFVVPEEKTKDHVAFQAELWRRTEGDSGQNRRYKERTQSCSFSLSLSLSLSLFLLFVPSRVESRLTARHNGVAAFVPRPRESRVPTASLRRPREQRCRPDILFVTQRRPTCVEFVNCKRYSLNTRIQTIFRTVMIIMSFV